MIELKPPAPTDMQGIKKHINYRLPYHHPEVPFSVIWSHKAGCTVILRWYLFQAQLLLEASSYEKAKQRMRLHEYEHDVFKARDGYRMDLIRSIAAGKPIICFLRCPYTRAFSSYLQVNSPRIMSVTREGGSSRAVELRKSILEFAYGKSNALDRPMPFIAYLEWLKAQDTDDLNRHHSPQVSDVMNYCDVNIFRLEQLTDIAKQMEGDLQLRSSHKHPKMFKSKHAIPKLEASPQEVGRLLDEGITLERRKRTPIPGVTREFLSSRPEGALIEEIFARDIGLYDATTLL